LLLLYEVLRSLTSLIFLEKTCLLVSFFLLLKQTSKTKGTGVGNIPAGSLEDGLLRAFALSSNQTINECRQGVLDE
jgi:hypothetical protein